MVLNIKLYPTNNHLDFFFYISSSLSLCYFFKVHTLTCILNDTVPPLTQTLVSLQRPLGYTLINTLTNYWHLADTGQPSCQYLSPTIMARQRSLSEIWATMGTSGTPLFTGSTGL